MQRKQGSDSRFVNPVTKIRDLLHPNVAIPKEIRARLETGKMLHKFAALWFREIEGYSEEESILDGAFVGIPGVRGKIDSFIRKSIIEFKTKDEKIGEPLPKSSSEVVNNYPNDLEQLVYYSAIHPDHPQENYLVFMRTGPPQTLAAYKVNIANVEAVKSLLKERMASVQNAMDKKDDSGLGRCRYYEKGCHHKTLGLCACSSLNPYGMEKLLKHVSITEDKEFTSKLEAARKKVTDLQKETIYPSTILYPRKYYSRVKEQESNKILNKDWHSESCLWHCVKKMGFEADDLSKQSLQSTNERIRCKSGWKKIPMSGKSEDIVIPYINKVSTRTTPPQKPSPYALAELAIICGLYEIQRGLIFVMYPKVNKSVHAFEVKFENLEDIQKEVSTRLNELDNAISNGDPSRLPSLPSFMV